MTDAFVELADTLIPDFDPDDFVQLLADRCVELFDVAAAGVLVDLRGRLQQVGASCERVRALHAFQLQRDEGPTLECYRTGVAVSVPDLDASARRWPLFTPMARRWGFDAVHTVPMRLRSEIIGALSLFRVESGSFDDAAVETAQAMADVATIGLLQKRAIGHQEAVAAQLQQALNSRVVIEQAKGVVAGRLGLDVDVAFELVRGYARAHHARISAVGEAIVAGTLDLKELAAS
ncbi:GAF and ANTAR domain-containing protein [Kutzneria sp. CA-103260]|uniref:GAF and ANTAR domain-containing protein n=1 Tax=Kutzneria sp. CA-103260 TaxID=2802641 RepID=UPI001BEF140D|nr:GAF and ANTAR domain-containing protein [Kutzneria sp. CA-103260]QUQ64118.1 ANTAR domain-containing protein [Kutzneria sp. CA-103260]